MKRSLCIFIVLLLMLPSMAGCSGQTTVPDSQLELLIADALSGKGRSILESESALERAMKVGSLDHWEAEHSADPEAHLDSVYLRLFVSVPTGIFEFGLPCVYQYWRDSDTWTLVSQSEIEECGIVSYNEDFFNSFVGKRSGQQTYEIFPTPGSYYDWVVNFYDLDYDNGEVILAYSVEKWRQSELVWSEEKTGICTIGGTMDVEYDRVVLPISAENFNRLYISFSADDGFYLDIQR